MQSEKAGSVTRWIEQLKQGGDAAAIQQLWGRYFEKLVRLAHKRLRLARRPGAIEDEEDAVLDAFEQFCRLAAAGRFPRLSDRNDLWGLLVVMTQHHAADQLRRQRAAKRGGGKLVELADDADAFDRFAGPEPTPEFAAMLAEEYQRRRDALAGDPVLRTIFDMRLEGYSLEEIAARLGCVVRTVSRKLDRMQQSWLEDEA